MPWKNESIMDNKVSFINDYETGLYTKTYLCQYYGISRPTGDRLIKRWEEEGMDFLKVRSRRPHNSPLQTDKEVIDRILHWRKGGLGEKSKIKWGGLKIEVKLLDEFAGDRVPSSTTITNILRDKGCIQKKRSKPRSREVQRPRFETSSCNEIISADYKGYRLLGNGRKCYPLTICDNYSRFYFRIKAAYRESKSDVIAAFRSVFREYGLPKHVLTDNGSPFCSSQSPCGYGAFSIFLLDQDVVPLFSDPGCPTQNGKHERAHRDLQAQCFSPPAYDLRVQSRRFNRWAKNFNEDRPHEGLDMKTPASVYEPSPRLFKEKVKEYVYDEGTVVRKVYSRGVIRWGSYEWVSISRSLAGRYIGLKQLGSRSWEVYYRQYCLGQFTEGDDVIDGRYYRLTSQLDLPEKYRHWDARKRK